jgi:hypothetical protein
VLMQAVEDWSREQGTVELPECLRHQPARPRLVRAGLSAETAYLKDSEEKRLPTPHNPSRLPHTSSTSSFPGTAIIATAQLISAT